MKYVAVILAGGKGERIKPLGKNYPKPLLTICNESIIASLIRQLTDSRIQAIVVVLAKTNSQVREEITSLKGPNNLPIRVVETSAKGTIAAVRAATKQHRQNVLVVYGDSWMQFNVKGLLNAHEKFIQFGSKATILFHRPKHFRDTRNPSRTYHGILSVNSKGRVTRFEEKPRLAEISSTFCFANAAVFILDPSLSCSKGDFSIDVFQNVELLQKGGIYAVSIGHGKRIDIGTPDRLFTENMSALSKLPIRASRMLDKCKGGYTNINEFTVRNKLYCGKSVLIGNNTLMEPGVRFEGQVIVGDRCILRENAFLKDCVLMQGCEVAKNVTLEQVLAGRKVRILRSMEGNHFKVVGDYESVR